MIPPAACGTTSPLASAPATSSNRRGASRSTGTVGRPVCDPRRMDEQIVAVDEALATQAIYRTLLEDLDHHHQLNDSSFTGDRWLSAQIDDGWLRLIAIRDGVLAGFLAGSPSQGHIALVGSLRPGHGTGSALLAEFTKRAIQAGARVLTVVLDTEIEGRWQRKQFFQARGFHALPRSALHFVKNVPGRTAD